MGKVHEDPLHRDNNERLTRLIEANSVDLFRYLLRRVDDAEDAADLLSETMLVTWRRIGALPAGDERARMWMFATARRVLSNHHRGLRRKSALAERLRSEIRSAEAMVSAHEDDFEFVRQAVMALPPKQREVVTLVHWENFSLTEVADIVGASPSTVRGRYAKARFTLHGALSPERTASGSARLNAATARRDL